MQRKGTKHPPPPFDLRLASPASQYNALTDPHANYYFVSQSAKQRLKQLKRELRRQKHQKSSGEKQMLKLIREKIKFKFPKIQLPLVNQQQMTAIISSSRQHSSYNFTRKHDYSRGASLSRREDAFESLYGERERSETDTKKSISCSRGDELGKSINHSDFMQFLAQRKNKLIDLSTN